MLLQCKYCLYKVMAKYYISAYIFGQEEESLSQIFIYRSGSPCILLKNNITASWISVLNYNPCFRIDVLSSRARGAKNSIISYWHIKKMCNSDLGTEVSSQLLDLNICMYTKVHMESLQTSIKVREQKAGPIWNFLVSWSSPNSIKPQKHLL